MITKKIKSNYKRWWVSTPLWAKGIYAALVLTVLAQVVVEVLEGHYDSALMAMVVPALLLAVLPNLVTDDKSDD